MQTFQSYLLRNVPKDTLQAAHRRARGEKRPLRLVLIDLLRYYAKHGIPS